MSAAHKSVKSGGWRERFRDLTMVSSKLRNPGEAMIDLLLRTVMGVPYKRLIMRRRRKLESLAATTGFPEYAVSIESTQAHAQTMAAVAKRESQSMLLSPNDILVVNESTRTSWGFGYIPSGTHGS